MAKDNALFDRVDTDTDNFMLDMCDDDGFDLGHAVDVRGQSARKWVLMSTVAVVALAGLGYLTTAGAQQLDQLGGALVSELSALDARDDVPGFPPPPDVTKLSRVETISPTVDGSLNDLVSDLIVLEPASGSSEMAGVPSGPNDDQLTPAPGFVPAPPPAPAPAPVVADLLPEPVPAPIVLSPEGETAPPMPDLSGLQGVPDPVSGREAASGTSESRKVVAPAMDSDGDVYYDSTPGVPTGALSNTVGPRKVDPIMEPASKMVIVQKDHGVGDTESLVVAARRALELGRYEAALEMYDSLYAKNKRDVRILMGRAVAQQNVGFRELAIQSYEEVLVVDPNNTDAVINMMGMLQQEYPSVALRRLLDLREKHPSNAGLMAQIGMTFATMGQMQDAVRALGAAASLSPRNAAHQYNLAVLYDRAGDRANALKHYEQALETDAVYGAGRSIPRDQVYDRLSTLRSR